jgi:DedD protein
MDDTEITLGTGRLLGLFFGLVVVCAVFFALGYSLGRKSASPAPLTADGDAAGLATNPSEPKPTATRAVVPPKPDCSTTAEGCGETAPTTTEADPAASTPPQTPTGATAAPESKPGVAPAPEVARPTNGYIVQVAAVSKQQDADALVAALKKKQYAVFVATVGSDTLFHVQIGPFAEQKDAESVRGRLIADGYNPIVKK